MSIYNSRYLIKLAESKAETLEKSIHSVIAESMVKIASKEETNDRYDIFLSHRFLDSKEILGIITELENFGYAVFVDWLEDLRLSRTSISKHTAAKLKKYMVRSRALFFATTSNYRRSKWMPWELGYMDGKKNGRVAILPVSDTNTNHYYGQEYLGLYPYISKEKGRDNIYKIWVNEQPDIYVTLEKWLDGSNPRKHR